jgi:hypothetical protein
LSQTLNIMEVFRNIFNKYVYKSLRVSKKIQGIHLKFKEILHELLKNNKYWRLLREYIYKEVDIHGQWKLFKDVINWNLWMM